MTFTLTELDRMQRETEKRIEKPLVGDFAYVDRQSVVHALRPIFELAREAVSVRMARPNVGAFGDDIIDAGVNMATKCIGSPDTHPASVTAALSRAVLAMHFEMGQLASKLAAAERDRDDARAKLTQLCGDSQGGW